MTWFYKKGELSRDGWDVLVDGSIKGWQHTGLRVGTLGDNRKFHLPADGLERIIFALEGQGLTVEYRLAGDSEFTSQFLRGRKSVFHGTTDMLYLPVDTEIKIQGDCRVCIGEAPAKNAKPVNFMAAEDVPVFVRGAGRESRQVHNFGTPTALDAARLIVCEVITPAGNWSSYPPHKHDHYTPGVESHLEEIYYFETALERGVHAPATAEPFGYMQTSSTDAGNIETLAEVHSGDIALVPFGWHGPCVAGPGYDMYYLNVMAGPDPERTWLIADEPAHAWVRSTWDNQQVDPRLPYTAE